MARQAAESLARPGQVNRDALLYRQIHPNFSDVEAECRDKGLLLEHDPDPFPEHAVIDFSGLSKSGIKSAAKKLAAFANRRGWQYGPIG